MNTTLGSKTWTRIEDYQSLVLCRGLGKEPESGLCVMQTVAWFAGEPLSDHPECASPVLTNFAIVVNDGLEQDQRQQLLKLVVALSGSRADAYELQRAELLIVHVAKELLAPTMTDADRRRFAEASNCAQIAKALLRLPSSGAVKAAPRGRRSMTHSARQVLRAIELFEAARAAGSAPEDLSRAVADAAMAGVMFDREGGKITSILEQAIRIGATPGPAAASGPGVRDDRASASGYVFRKRNAPCPSPSSQASIPALACAAYASSTGPGG